MYTPTTEELRTRLAELTERAEAARNEYANLVSGPVFDRWLVQVKAEAWDEGHRHRQRRGPDDCPCGAWYEGECACGQYGTGDLLSLADNPYREEEGDD